jgi:hypothetical protein
MTTKNYIFPPTPDFLAQCEACCKNFIVNKNALTEVIIGLMHIVPFGFMSGEFAMNGINFYWRHYLIFVSLSIGYLGVNLLQSFLSKDKSAIYPCLDWHRRPDIASAVVVAFLIVECLVFWLLIKLTSIKLARNFKIDIVLTLSDKTQ